MFGFQEQFDHQIKELFSPKKLGVRLLARELEKIGIFIDDAQRIELEGQFINSGSDSLILNFSDEQLRSSGVSSEEELKRKIQKIMDALPVRIDKVANDLDEIMHDLVDGVSDSMAESVLQTLEKRMDDMKEDQEAIYNNFAYGIEAVWGEALTLLQGLIVIADESSDWYINRDDEYKNNQVVHDLLIHINAKSIQVSKEILTLLKNGYSDGAWARWRTLHELAVIGVFISEHGQDLAERYINHESIDIYKAALQYREHFPKRGASEISEEDMSSMREDYQRLLNRYGQSYKHEYGWAAEALNLSRPTFRDIESSVNLDHYRPYYKSASANVHGNPSGVFSSLGLLQEDSFILSGPSSVGLFHPARSTIYSLSLITITMLSYGANVDSIVICKAISKYSIKVESTFVDIESTK